MNKGTDRWLLTLPATFTFGVEAVKDKIGANVPIFPYSYVTLRQYTAHQPPEESNMNGRTMQRLLQQSPPQECSNDFMTIYELLTALIY